MVDDVNRVLCEVDGARLLLMPEAAPQDARLDRMLREF